MRFSSSAILALPLLAAAAESPFEQYKAQFQNFLGSFGSYGAKTQPDKASPVQAAEKKLGEKAIKVLTLENWRNTLYGPVKPTTTKPVEWWVLMTGGNKTCFGHCGKIEAAFNETAGKWALQPSAPYTALLNCDNEPVLCNGWSAGTGALWVFEMLPPPAPVDIWRRRMNLTTTTSQTYNELRNKDAKANKVEFKLHDGWFHPFNGPFARYGLSEPLGYFFWAFNLVPSWTIMVLVSFLSRTMMTRRMGNRPPATGAAGAPPTAARR